MKNKILSVLFTLVILTVTAAVPLSAKEAGYVFDDAGLFGNTSSLENDAKALSDLTGWNIMIITTYYADGKETRVYAADYYEKYYEPSSDCVLYIIDMDNRENAVVCGGEGEYWISDNKQNEILDRTTPLLKEKKYDKAAKAFLSAVEYYYNDGEGGTGAPPKPFDWSKVFVALGIGAVVAVISVLVVVKSYKVLAAPPGAVYMDRKETEFKEKSDVFIRKYTTSRVIESNSGGGGGGHSGGFSSSSGGHYSGSSRSF